MADRENLNGRTADRRFPNRHRAVPPEVAVPFVPSRVEQWRDLSGPRLSAREVWSLVEVASVACPGGIGSDGSALVLPGDNMFHVKGGPGGKGLGEVADSQRLPARSWTSARSALSIKRTRRRERCGPSIAEWP